MTPTATTPARRVGQLRIPRPRDYQRPILEHAARNKVVAAGRRWGKSTTGLVAAITGHGPIQPDGRPLWPGAIHGLPIYWVVPDFPTSGYDRWRDVKSACRDAWVSKSELEHRVVLPGGGSVAVRSADDPDSLRGPGLVGAVFDEFPLMPERTWTEAVRPALSDLGGWALFLSTPKGRAGRGEAFFRLFLRGTDDATLGRYKIEGDPRRTGWASFQRPSRENPQLTGEDLDDARLDLGALRYAQEYDADFVVSGGTVIRSAWFRYYDVAGGRTIVIEGDSPRRVDAARLTRFATVDLATSTKTSADYTVVSTFAALPTGELVLIDHLRARLEGPDIGPALHAQWVKHRHARIYVENAGFQLSIIQDARRRGLPIRPIRPDGDKHARALHLAARLEAGMLYFPRAAAWLGALEEELEDFGGPDAGHDDQVDTLAYACIAQTEDVGRTLVTHN